VVASLVTRWPIPCRRIAALFLSQPLRHPSAALVRVAFQRFCGITPSGQIAGNDRGVIRVRVRDGTAERVVDLKNVHLTGALFGFWFGLDPTDAPLLLRDISGDDIYALTLETK
jgi:hypothetical protein